MLQPGPNWLKTGSVQTFTAPVSGWYNFILYGGDGGRYCPGSGLGGKTTAEFYVNKDQTLYILVGGASSNYTGPNITEFKDGWRGGWNGGANGISVPAVDYVFKGSGGATDVRLSSAGNGSTNWKEGLGTRIAVAGGAAGSDDVNHDTGNPQPGGGNGGGFTGGSGFGLQPTRGGTQTSGYAKGQGQPTTGACGGSGGGGYWGGYMALRSSGGGGGSSYVSGNTFCPEKIPGWEARTSNTVMGGHADDTHTRHGFARVYLTEITEY